MEIHTTEEKQKKHKPIKTIRLILAGVILCAAIGAGCFLFGRSSAGAGQQTQVSATVLKNQLETINELASVSYSYTNMAQFENSNDFYGMKIPFTTKSFLITYDGVIKAGVDLRQAKVSVNGKSVSAKLPEAKILSHTIDENSVKTYDEKTSIFNALTVEDFKAFQTDQKTAMEKKAVERGLLTEAKKKAANCVESFLKSALPQGYSCRLE